MEVHYSTVDRDVTGEGAERRHMLHSLIELLQKASDISDSCHAQMKVIRIIGLNKSMTCDRYRTVESAGSNIF